MEMEDRMTCPTCEGTGEVEDNGAFYYHLEPHYVTCPDCGRTGKKGPTWGWTKEDFAAEEADNRISEG